MMRKLGPSRFGGDDNAFELTHVCATCESTTLVPPKTGHMVTQGASMPCTACKTGYVVQRFKTIDELKAFIATL